MIFLQRRHLQVTLSKLPLLLLGVQRENWEKAEFSSHKLEGFGPNRLAWAGAVNGQHSTNIKGSRPKMEDSEKRATRTLSRFYWLTHSAASSTLAKRASCRNKSEAYKLIGPRHGLRLLWRGDRARRGRRRALVLGGGLLGVAEAAQDVGLLGGEADGGEHGGPAVARGAADGDAALVPDVGLAVHEEDDDLARARPQPRQRVPALGEPAAAGLCARVQSSLASSIYLRREVG